MSYSRWKLQQNRENRTDRYGRSSRMKYGDHRRLYKQLAGKVWSRKNPPNRAAILAGTPEELTHWVCRYVFGYRWDGVNWCNGNITIYRDVDPADAYAGMHKNLNALSDFWRMLETFGEREGRMVAVRTDAAGAVVGAFSRKDKSWPGFSATCKDRREIFAAGCRACLLAVLGN